MPFLWEPTLNDRAARLWFNEINRLMFYVTQITADIQDIVTAVQPREDDTILMIDSRIKALLVRRREQLLSNRAKLTVLVSRQTDFEPSQFVPKEGPTSRFLNQQQVNRIVASEAGVQQWYQIGLSLLSATTGRMFLKSDHNSLNGYGAQVKNMLRYLLGVDTCPSFPQEREPESNAQSLAGSNLVFFEDRNEAVDYARNIEIGAVRQSVSRELSTEQPFLFEQDQRKYEQTLDQQQVVLGQMVQHMKEKTNNNVVFGATSAQLLLPLMPWPLD